MTGYILKRNNSYAFVYYTYNINGEKIQKWVGGFKTKKEAEIYRRKYNRNTKEVQKKTSQPVTLGEYLDNWLESYCKKRLAQNTVRGYKVNINHIKEAIGNVYIEDISASTLDTLFLKLDEKGLSGTTQLYIYNVLHKAFETGIKRQEILFNFCEMIEPPRKNRFKGAHFDKEEFKTFIGALSNIAPEYELAVLFALLLGLRRGEVLGLKWSDINKSNSTVQIQRTATPVNGGYVFSDCKTEESFRTLLLPEYLKEKLVNWQRLQSTFFDVPPEYIFCTRNGRIFSATTLNKQYRKALADCNLNTKMRFHDLRHSFATHLINSNVAVNTVSNMLGHSKTSTTLDIYVHADLASQSTAIKALESVLETAPQKA